MANFKGHALPGSFFLVFGLWWSVKGTLKYQSKKVNKNGHANYRLAHLEITEGAVKMTMSLIGKDHKTFEVLPLLPPCLLVAKCGIEAW